jgi:hypothetical protein
MASSFNIPTCENYPENELTASSTYVFSWLYLGTMEGLAVL